MSYEIIESYHGQVIKRTDENGAIWSIPTDPANSDYQAYLAWVAEGNKATVEEKETN
jgi:hypothetical protein